MSNVMKNNFQVGVSHFVEANRKYWENDIKITDGEEWIYVLHTLHHEFATSVRENIVAKGVQEKEHLPIVSIISGKADELMDLMDQIDASFGIEHRFHPSYYSYINERIEELAEKMASETYGEKDGLLGLTYRGIQFGNVLYDDILRRGNNKRRGDVFHCFDISQERYCAFIRNVLAIIDQAYEMFEKKRPRYLVTTEYFYTKGLYANVACALGAKILITSVGCPDIVVQVNPDKYQLSDVKVADTTRVRMDKCLQSNQAKGECSENLFVLESEVKKKNLESKQWNGKKNVFILPHAFGDAPRGSCRHNIYYDYCEWFVDTLRIVRDIPNVNWIVKDHPVASYYGQEAYVRSVFEHYKTENMYWLDKEYNGMDIKKVADCVLTCAGDAGIEYWAYGIPTISVCDAHYCNWGISYQIKSLDEYENVLRNIANISTPPHQSVELAKKYLDAYKNWYKQSDALSLLIRKCNLANDTIWRVSGVDYGVKASVDQQLGKNVLDFCESFVAFLKESDLKSSSIYRLDNLLEV